MACIIYVSLNMYIRRYRDNGDGLSNRQHIFQIHRVRDIISLYEIHTLSLPAPGLMHYCRASLMYAICVDPHALLLTIHRSMQLVWFIMA
jgi:hypothetical protein